MSRAALKQRDGYAFEELSERAKEAARDWWRDCEAQGYDPQYTLEDCAAVAGILGFETDRAQIGWDVSCCQGSGASFTGDYGYSPDSTERLAAHAPGDRELHDIAALLAALQAVNGYRLRATLTRDRSNYCHENTVTVDVFLADDDGEEVEAGDVLEKLVTESARRFMRWIHHRITEDYEDRMSAECIDEGMDVYRFDEDGGFLE